MSPTLVAVGILLVAAVAVLVFLVLNANRKRKSYENVPPGMRPAYSDEQLERSVLERYMSWGVVLTLFFAVFLPVYWFNEASRLNAAQEGFFVSDVVRGEEEYQNLCARCHGPGLGGGAAPSPYVGEDGETSAWPAPALNNIVTRYAENPNISDIENFILETIEKGRPGTPMPTWGAAYGGSLTDQQMENITAFILSQQTGEVDEAQAAANLSGEELYTQNCLKCHGPELMAEPDRPGVSLIGVFDRHSPATVLGILRNGIYRPTGAIMPPWQNGYMYPEARYTDEALTKVMDYLAAAQPETADDQASEGETGSGAEADADAQDADAQGDDAQGDDAQGDEAQGDEAQGDEAQGDDAQGDDAQGDDATDAPVTDQTAALAGA